MTDSEERRTLVTGTPDERADAREKAYKRGRQGRFNRNWIFLAVVLLFAVGYAIYRWAQP